MSTSIFTPTKNTWLHRAVPLELHGSDVDAYFGTLAAGADVYRMLVQWDISDLAGQVVMGATLRFNILSHGDNNVNNYYIYRMTRDYTESEACWTNYAAAAAWTTPGGDFTATGAVTVAIPHVDGILTIPSAATLVALVQDAITTRAGIFSIMLRRVTEAASDVWLQVASNDETNDQPILEVTTLGNPKTRPYNLRPCIYRPRRMRSSGYSQ